MKKLIFAILILCLLMPAAAMADDMAGCYVFWMPNSASFGSGNFGAVCMLNENGEMAFMYTTPNENGLEAVSVTGTWTATENSVTITSYDYPLTLEYKNGMIWFPVGKMNVAMKKVPFSIDQMEYIQE